ncbi:phosphatase PAP2 family protein [Candidatus Uabimicrobium amorphum]|uniref:Phosphatidic acid phosphatase n=1 Tax=Uabimicrobium amorphum TaxID=2596890 RepID=A0A5S9F662_UABAM|nr:phosphatase PAP2 family protein [Candidatus Uabimicrobium amorphum]BBM85992.1 phosphatidic acid phosphatase [Candidatus Uabimicrobium amorphum]
MKKKLRERLEKKSFVALIGITVMLFFQIVYFLIQYYVEPAYDLQTSLDKKIPFLPWTVIIYLAIYPFILAVVLLIDVKDFMRVIAIYLLTCATGWLFFIFFPAAITRPSLTTIDNKIWYFVYSWIHHLDATTNTFPSLHVAASWVTALILWRRKTLFFAASCVATLISLSTLTTKQHFIYDVIGGFVLAVICWYVIVRKEIK